MSEQTIQNDAVACKDDVRESSVITLGEHGLFEIPSELQDLCQIQPHEKLLIFRLPMTSQLVLMKNDCLPDFEQFCDSLGDVLKTVAVQTVDQIDDQLPQ